MKEIADRLQKAIGSFQEAESMTCLEYFLTKQRRRFFYEARLIPVFENQIIMIVRNITERKEAEKNLQLAFEKLKKNRENLSKAERLAFVGETSGRVAHEVLNPITSVYSRVENNLNQWQEFNKAVSGTREIISDWQNEYHSGSLMEYLNRMDNDGGSFGDEDFALLNSLVSDTVKFQEERENDLKFILKQIQRVIRIVNNLRELAMTQRSITTFTISKAIHEAYEALEDSLKKRNIEFKTSFPASIPPISADETEIIQVLTNLFRNAMQSIEEKKQGGGLIKAEVKVDKDSIQIRIKDNGSGIPKNLQHAIFDYDFSTKTRDRGTGLGLGVSRRFVHENSRNIVLEESIEGVGSTFLITVSPAE